MADQWYYGGAENKQGPFTGQQMRDMAAAGTIRPTDTIWKEGMAQGVPAQRVKNLFPTASPSVASAPASASTPATEPPPASSAPPMQTGTAIATAGASPPPSEPPSGVLAAADAPAEKPAAAAAKTQTGPKRKARALAISGAVIVSQDGETAFYRKKCPKCGHEETGRSRTPIRNGTIRVSYFCPKCRKVQQAVIQGAP
jgi:hypothetical protein